MLKGLFLSAQLHSSYIFALNYKPFGSGGFHQQKKDMMEKFVSTTSPANSSLWDAFREKIALDLGRELSGDEHEIENMLADVDSFMKKGSIVKSSRCSAGTSYVMSNFTSFMSSKCCWRIISVKDESFSPCSRERRSLHSNSANTQPGKELFEGRVPESEGRVPDGEGQEDALGDLQKLSQAGRATDPRKELSLLKASMGGFKLAYYLMTEAFSITPKFCTK